MNTTAFEQAMNCGLAEHRAGNLNAAESAYRQAIALDAHSPDALHLLGLVAHQSGRHQAAVDLIVRAISLNPNAADFHCNLGLALAALPRPTEAEAAYRQSLRLEPDHATALCNLGRLLRGAGKVDEAISLLRRAVQLRPDYFEAHNNLGNALQDREIVDEAIDCFNRALALRPDNARVHHNLGNAYFVLGDVPRAIASYEKAISLKPDDASIASRRLIALQYHPKYDAAAILAEYKMWDDRYARPLRIVKPTLYPRDRSRRLRIGYISADFRDHVAGWYLWPLLSRHDHARFEIYCYSNVARPDLMTQRLAKHADVWREIHQLNDDAAAEMIRADQLDVLVDLSMHTDNNRLLVLARQPAPVQVAWLAYPGTTGMSVIDYRLTDPYFDPPGKHDHWYAEKSVRLPKTFLCYEPMSSAAFEMEAGPPPMETNGYVTFGCLNKASRLNDRVWELWSPILRAMPTARLMLCVAPAAQARILTGLAAQGIEARRVEFVPHAPWRTYLEYYRRIDVILDTLPYNGNTTSMDALWMGVPVVTRIGNTVAGRAGWSLLSNLKLPELAARTDEEFTNIAIELAGDAGRLTELRLTLRRRMMESPLCDGPGFARNVEAAYQRMCLTS
jgi:predicted O-linked N-acetylglucosamine transferase (SPINDLY family)